MFVRVDWGGGIITCPRLSTHESFCSRTSSSSGLRAWLRIITSVTPKSSEPLMYARPAVGMMTSVGGTSSGRSDSSDARGASSEIVSGMSMS